MIKTVFLMALTSLLLACQSQEQQCKQSGNKWASAKAQCITPSCAKTKSCGIWANPNQWCLKVQIGQSKDDLRFWLGEPDRETSTQMTWYAAKGENAIITAEFVQGALVKFDCPDHHNK